MKDKDISKDKLIKELRAKLGAALSRIVELEHIHQEHGRKQIEDKIRQQNKFLAQILDSLSHPFYVVDAYNYTIKMANSAAKFSDLSEKSTCYALTHNRSTPCRGTEHLCPLEEVKKTKKPLIVEHVHYNRDGNTINVEVYAFPILDEAGNVSEIIEYTLDITERKRAEEARIKQVAALARTRELQQSRQRIVTAQESLRKDIAQQLHGSVQNRLVVLLHQLTELERIASSEKLSVAIGNVRLELVELLESHIRPITYHLYPYIIRRGLIPALESLGDQIEAALTLEMKLPKELIHQERANPNLIPELIRLAVYRIAEEALTNIVKYAKASRATVRLELSSEEWLHLTVVDNGQGFDVKRAAGGLGVLMMQDYAELTGGKCTIRSTPGKGTEVTATLPFAGSGEGHLERASPLE